MKYLDYACAWTILVSALVFIVGIEIWHLRAILDVPFLWLLVAMFNFLRLRNDYVRVQGLRICCIGANLVGLVLESMRLKLFWVAILRDWGPYPLIVANAVVGETIFSAIRQNYRSSPVVT